MTLLTALSMVSAFLCLELLKHSPVGRLRTGLIRAKKALPRAGQPHVLATHMFFTHTHVPTCT